MKYFVKNLIVYLFVSLSLCGYSQSNAIYTSDSQVLMLFDRGVYMKGEVVYGSILFKDIVANGKVLKCSVTNFDQSVTSSFYIKITDTNIASFYIPLTEEYSEATYTVRFSTLSAGEEMQIVEGTFNLINNQKPLSSNPNYIYADIIKLDAKKEYDMIHIDEIGMKYTFGLQGNDAIKKIRHINIVDQEYQYGYSSIFATANKYTQAEVDMWSDKLFYNIALTNSKNITSFKLAGLYSDNMKQTYLSKTGKDGLATFLIDDFVGNFQFQLLGYPSETNDLYEAQLPSKTILPILREILPNGYYKEYAKSALQRANINKQFNIETFIIQTVAFENSIIDVKPDKVYKPNNFKKFNTLHDFCKENILPLQFEGSSKTVAFLLPPFQITKEYGARWADPLFLIDGVVSRKYNSISELKAQDIESINVYFKTKNLSKYFSAFTQNGLVEIITKEPKKTMEKLKYNHFVSLNGFQPRIASPQQLLPLDEGVTPYLFLTAYWNEVKQQDKVSFEISTPRVSGQSIMAINVITINDKNQWVLMSKPIK